MARIPYADTAALPEGLRDWARGGILDLGRMMLHSPALTEPFVRLGATQFGASGFDPVDRELAILAIGAALRSPYEWEQHIPISDSVGVTAAQRDAIAAGEPDSPLFTPAQRALVRFVDAVARTERADDRTLADLREQLGDTAVVEAIMLVGYYFTIARLTTTLDIEPDPRDDASVLDQAARLG